MKKLAQTIGLLTLMLIVTSFTTPTEGGGGKDKPKPYLLNEDGNGGKDKPKPYLQYLKLFIQKSPNWVIFF